MKASTERKKIPSFPHLWRQAPATATHIRPCVTRWLAGAREVMVMGDEKGKIANWRLSVTKQSQTDENNKHGENLITRKIVTKSSSCYSIKVKKSRRKRSACIHWKENIFTQCFSCYFFFFFWQFLSLEKRTSKLQLHSISQWQGYNEGKLRRIHYNASFNQNKGKWLVDTQKWGCLCFRAAGVFDILRRDDNRTGRTMGYFICTSYRQSEPLLSPDGLTLSFPPITGWHS